MLNGMQCKILIQDAQEAAREHISAFGNHASKEDYKPIFEARWAHHVRFTWAFSNVISIKQEKDQAEAVFYGAFVAAGDEALRRAS